MVKPSEPKVSILVLTYNHEKYIEDALGSVLRQQTTVPYEIIVAEDCSTDRTLEKVKAIAKRNPGLFRILHRERNMGICRNFADAYGQCLGEYVAILEGDDYWHHNHRLQRHVDILDRDKKCSFVFNNVRAVFEDGRVQDGLYPPHVRTRLRLRDFLADNFVNCSSLTFRHRLISAFPKWFLALSYYDWPLHIFHLQHGHAIYLRDTLSTYRIHRLSAWNGSDQETRLRGMIDIFHGLDEHFGYRYHSILRLNEKYRTLWLEREQARVENDELRRILDDEYRWGVEVRKSKAFKIAQLLSRVRKGVTAFLPKRAA